MTQKEFDRLREIRREIMRLEEEIEYYRSAAEPGAQELTGMPVGEGKNKIEVAVCNAGQLEREQSMLREEGMKLIACIQPARVRNIFRAYYLDAMTWETVAEKCGYSCGRAARRVCREYLKKFKIF